MQTLMITTILYLRPTKLCVSTYMLYIIHLTDLTYCPKPFKKQMLATQGTNMSTYELNNVHADMTVTPERKAKVVMRPTASITLVN